MVADTVTVWDTCDDCVQASGISFIPLRAPFGQTVGLEVRVAPERDQLVTSQVFSSKRFILCHSLRNHLSVDSGIFAPARVVSKYFTQSTPAP